MKSFKQAATFFGVSSSSFFFSNSEGKMKIININQMIYLVISDAWKMTFNKNCTCYLNCLTCGTFFTSTMCRYIYVCCCCRCVLLFFFGAKFCCFVFFLFLCFLWIDRILIDVWPVSVCLCVSVFIAIV